MLFTGHIQKADHPPPRIVGFFTEHPEMKGREFFMLCGLPAVVEYGSFPSNQLDLYAGEEHVATVVIDDMEVKS